MSGSADQKLVADTWRRVCFHLDGLAIGASVEALDETGLLDTLAAGGAARDVRELAHAFDLRPGYLNLVFRLLELQGFVARSGDIPAGGARVCLTDAGRSWHSDIHAYRGFRGRIEDAGALLGGEPVAADIDDNAGHLSERVALHRTGPMAAAAMTALARAQVFDPPERALPLSALPHPAVADILAGQGWASRDGGDVVLTEAGQLALQFAPQYFYPVSYLPMLAVTGDLLRGRAADSLGRADDGTEGHVDRELDIAFSGIVFARTCRDPFFELALPLFDELPLDDQPRAVVDCGAGDGTVLCELFRAIADRTRRGAAFDSHPLTMVGVEYNPVAERVLADRLAAAVVPNLVFSGDIGNPAAIAERLNVAGFGPDDVLHVSKSVFHNRTFLGNEAPVAGVSAGAFVRPDGELLSAGAVEADLEALFRAWAGCLGRHGMIAIEAHIVAPALTTERLGRSVTTSLEASHGYSHQYLLEIGPHRAAAARAGLRTVAARDFGTPFVGAPIMSIDHLGV